MRLVDFSTFDEKLFARISAEYPVRIPLRDMLIDDSLPENGKEIVYSLFGLENDLLFSLLKDVPNDKYSLRDSLSGEEVRNQ